MTSRQFGIETVALPGWDTFQEYIRSAITPTAPNWVFRGQRDETWKLESTFDRVLRSASVQSGPRLALQSRHLEAFKQAARGRRGPNPPRLDSENDWWALGQHHGLATPLLDWTSSPYVAAFFAFADDGYQTAKHRVVFALNEHQIYAWHAHAAAELLSYFEPEDIESYSAREYFGTVTVTKQELDLVTEQLKAGTYPRQQTSKLFGHLFGAIAGRSSQTQNIRVRNQVPDHLLEAIDYAPIHTLDRFLPLELFRPPSDENPRLINQSGLFTRLPAVARVYTIEDQLAALFSRDYDGTVLTRILIPNRDREGILQDLAQMNIHHASLFPDLAGASLYCNLLQTVYRLSR